MSDFFYSVADAPCHFLGVRISGLVQTCLGLDGAQSLHGKKPVRWEDMEEPEGFSEDEKTAFNGFSSRKRQMEWLAARLAAKRLARKVLDFSFPMEALSIEKKEKGAPFLPAFPEYAISISHGGDWAVCGLCTEKGRRIGLDVEAMDKKDREAFVRIAWSKREADLLGDVSDEEIVRHWTRKEAVLKILGEGFHFPLKRVEILPSGVYLAGELCSGLRCRTFAIGSDHFLSVADGRLHGPGQSLENAIMTE